MALGLPATVKFSVNWKVPWSEFGTITLSKSIGKFFVTSHNNVCLRWESVLQRNDIVQSENEFYLYYDDGPFEKFGGMSYSVAIVKQDQTILKEMNRPNYEAIRSFGSGWPQLISTDGAAVRQRYGLQETDDLTYRIVLNIPISAFTYKMENPLPATTPPQWLVDLFNVIDDPEKSVYSNAKMISRDGHSFYCHKVIAFQSAALDAMFRHPPGLGQVENEYEFPGLSKEALKSLIEYLYKGQTDLRGLSTPDLIDLADSSEQYDLKVLKQACASVLWDRVTKEQCIAYQVVQFASLHQDMKQLKYRAMDVLAESSKSVDSSGFGEGQEGKKLLDVFLKFACCRVEAI